MKKPYYYNQKLFLLSKYEFAIKKLKLTGSVYLDEDNIHYINGCNIVVLDEVSFIRNVLKMKETKYITKAEFKRTNEIKIELPKPSISIL